MIRNLELLNDPSRCYTILIGGNGGEAEMAISCTMGQDGNTLMHAIAINIDGGPMESFNPPISLITGSRYCFPLIRTKTLVEALRSILNAWVARGLPPNNAAEVVEVAGDIERILTRLADIWMLA